MLADQGRRARKLGCSFHQSHAGAIIGRSGFKIKELREQTNTNLKVFGQCCPMSTDRVLQINGDLDKVVDAIRAVVTLLHDVRSLCCHDDRRSPAP